jgi:phosphoglycerol transferase MdoB-like AlkP superfamily enzyme
MVFIYGAQMVYFKVFTGIFSFYTMATGGQVLEFWRAILAAIASEYIRFGLMLLAFPIYFGLRKYLFDFSKNKTITNIIVIISFILLSASTFIYIFTDKKDIYSSYNLYFNTQAPILSAKKFGLANTMLIDLKRSIFGMKKKTVEINVDNDNTNSGNDSINYNNIDIDFDSLIKNETDKTIISMHKYFESLEGTKKNDYTGMFEGKNVVFFLAESLDPLAIDPVLTPTLYKLANSGFNFSNYYSPLYPASTADGEFRTEWSLISSIGNIYTLFNYRNVYSPNLFVNSFEGYNMNVYHNYNGDYYNRRQYFSALGYKNFKACYYGLNLPCGTFHESDLDMVDITTDEYIDSEVPFFSYYITLSGHLSYVKSSNKIAQKNWDLVKDLPYSSNVKGYLAGNIELDRALQLLIERLTVAGKLDDTVIVVTPDHYPYGLKDNLEEISKITGVDRTDSFEMYHSDLIIWNSKMKTVKVNKVGSNPDILPTLLNLFGISYDSRMIVGQDLLSDSEGLVTLANRSWITDSGRYNSTNNENISNEGKLLDEKYIEKINNIVDNQFKISDMILENNYYKKVFKQEEID